MQNYRFTGPPPPGSVQPADPVVSELWRIQNAIHWIMQRAKRDEDFETALVAASQASANVQTIEAVSERREAAAAVKAIAEEAKSNTPAALHQSNTPAALYLIALRDHTVETATRYWMEGPFLHYLTPRGAHVQVRMDLIDRDLSTRLNRELNLEFRLPGDGKPPK
jgi:hypothetical protein